MADNTDNPMGTPPPPPPPPPGGDMPPPPSGGDFDPQDMFTNNGGMGEGQLESGKPTVAASPTRVFMVLGIMGLVLLYLLYNIFFSGPSKEEKIAEVPRALSGDNIGKAAPAPPPPLDPELIPAPPPITPPVVPEPQSLPEINQKDDAANNKALLDRLKSSMLIMNSSGGLFGGGSDGDQAETQLANSDSNMLFGSLVARSTTKAPRVTATHIGDMSRTIAQGRLIHATLESAINTDLPGPIRAIVSRDIYGEAGSQPLIPKGSRLIGQYNSSIMFGQSRVYVMWTRVLRPDGVDIAIGSPLVDQIGQAGIGGMVDNKFREMFSRSVLASVFSIAVAMAVDASGVDTQTSTTIGITGGTQTSGDAAGQATVEALQNLGSLTTNFIQRFINVKPTIVVDQGTPVMVFVNRDLIFPSQFMSGGMIP